MSVVIDEIVHENPVGQMVETGPGVAAPSDRASAAELPDLDRLGFEYSRRLHRITRLWAD